MGVGARAWRLWALAVVIVLASGSPLGAADPHPSIEQWTARADRACDRATRVVGNGFAGDGAPATETRRSYRQLASAIDGILSRIAVRPQGRDAVTSATALRRVLTAARKAAQEVAEGSGHGKAETRRIERKLPTATLASQTAAVTAESIGTLRCMTTFDTVIVESLPLHSPALEELAARSTMTVHARRLLFTAHPALATRDVFGQLCPIRERATYLLGCYDPVQRRIAVLDVQHPDLASIREVTAAHEMLHAAYALLDPNERAHIDALLAAYVESTHDPLLAQLLAPYALSAQANELHSFAGTVVATLPAELETYYGRYFVARAQVVAADDAFRGVFNGLERQAADLQAQLRDLRGQIDSLRAQADAAGAEARSLSQQIDSLRAQGRIAESNALVPAQNAAASRANSLLAQSNRLVDPYNALVEQYNQVLVVRAGLLDELRAVS